MASLRTHVGVAACALELLVLTTARTGEVTGAIWPEIDLQQAVWTIPAGRMKAGKEHRIPLCRDASVVLRQTTQLRRTNAPDEFASPFHCGVPLIRGIVREVDLYNIRAREDADGCRYNGNSHRGLLAPENSACAP
jgi:integrase